MFLRLRRTLSIRFNFVDPRRSTSRVTEIEISPPEPDVGRIADMQRARGISAERRYIQMYAGFVRGVPRCKYLY